MRTGRWLNPWRPMSRIHDRHGFTIPPQICPSSRGFFTFQTWEKLKPRNHVFDFAYFPALGERWSHSNHATPQKITERDFKYICLMSFRPKNLHWNEITWMANISVGILDVNAMLFSATELQARAAQLRESFRTPRSPWTKSFQLVRLLYAADR